MIFLQVSYYFVIFNIVSPETNFTLGYVPIALLSIYIIAMMLAIVFSSIKAIIWRLKVRFRLR